jgi:acetyl esterase/lipase
MVSSQAESLKATLWQLCSSDEGAQLPSVEEMRSLNDLMESLASEPPAVHFEDIDLEGIPAMWVTPEVELNDRVLIYLHGGGYVFGSMKSHRKLVGHMAKSIGCRALNLDYRLAPEHPFPAAVEDATKAYIWLLRKGTKPQHIALAGDSAGGGLCLACITNLLSKGYPLPSAIVMMSPWTDLALTGDSINSCDSVDPICQQPFLKQCADLYLAGQDVNSPLASPLYADFKRFPPMYIQVGECETLRDDSIRLVDKAKAAGIEVRLNIFPEMIHLFQLAVGNMPEADDAVERISKWLQGRF